MNSISRSYIKVFIALISMVLMLTSTLTPIASTTLKTNPEQSENGNSINSITASNDIRIDNILYEKIYLNFEYIQDTITLDGKEWDYIELLDGQHLLGPGQAMIPYKVHSYTTAKEIIDVSVDFSNPIILNNLELVPAPEPFRTGTNDNIDIDDDVVIDHDFYSTNEFLPRENSEWHNLGGQNADNEKLWFYSIVLYAGKYNPYVGVMELYQDCTITIKYTQPEPLVADQNEDTPVSSTRGGSRGSEPTEVIYLILTKEYLMDEMQVLADWKTQKGVPAEVYNVDNIYVDDAYKGRDNEETLRNFIRWMHENEGTEFVLLAGDYDRVPPRMTEDPHPYQGVDDGWIPSDLYYACIDEDTTWDNDNDDIFGELGDLDDIIPDIAIGRLAINDANIMALKIEEIIDYETEPPEGSWFGRTTLVGADVHNKGDGKERCEYYKSKYLNSVYSSFTKLYDTDDSLDKGSLKDAFNDGSTLLVYLGHGSSYVWTHEVHGTNILFDNSDVSTLTNGIKKPVITTVSCDTSWFDAPHNNPYGDCIAEAYTEKLDKGAIGYLGSSRTTYAAITQSYTSLTTGLQEDFIRQINRDNLQLGLAYVDGMAHYSQSWGHLYANSGYYGEEQACWLEYHLLGEPELTLWVNEPENFVVTNASEGDKIIIIVEDEQSNPVEDARVCIWLKDEVYDYGFTDSQGTIEFDVVTNSDDEADLTVTKTYFLPYISKIKLKDKIPPVTAHELSPGEPDGKNGWFVTRPFINLSVNENSQTYYRWDGSATPIEYDGVFPALEGAHTLYYYSVDIAGNPESEKSTVIKVDTVVPETGITCTPTEPDGENGWYLTVPKITLEKEQYSTLYYHWDSSPNSIYESQLNGLVGEHTLYYHARDEAGHIEPTQSIKIKLDLDTPSTDIILEPSVPDGEHLWYQVKPTISFEIDDMNLYNTYYYWDGDKNSTVEYTESFIVDLEGEHTIHYYTKDIAGNVESTKWLDINIDTVRPKTEIFITPEKPNGQSNWYMGDAPIIELTASEEKAKIYYYWDTETSRTIYSDPISAPEGEHILYYYSVDQAGNREGQRKGHFKVDTIEPTASYTIYNESPPNSNGWYLEMPNIEMDMSEDGIIYYYMIKEGQTLEDYTADELKIMRQTYIAIYPLEGIYTFHFYAVDDAGNIGDMTQFSIKMDLFEPLAEMNIDKRSLTEGEWAILNASGSRDENSIVAYRFYIGDEYYTDWQESPVFNYTFETGGSYEVYVKVMDPSGRISEPSDPINVTVRTIPRSDTSNDFMDQFSLPMIFVLLIIVIIGILIVVLVVRPRKAKRLRGYSGHGDHDDLDIDILPPGRPRAGAGIGGRHASRSMSGRGGRRRLKTPPPPPPELPPPPPPPSVVRIVSKNGSDDIIDDSAVDWDSGDDQAEDEIDWDDGDSGKKVKLECPVCNEQFKKKASNLKGSKTKNIKCPHCGAKGGL